LQTIVLVIITSIISNNLLEVINHLRSSLDDLVKKQLFDYVDK